MTNFDPGGLLMLLTLLVSLPMGLLSVGGAHLAARVGVGDYERNVAAMVGFGVLLLVVAGLMVSDAILQLLGVALAMVGAYAVTRSVRDASYGWVLGVVVLFLAFWAAAATGLYQGVNRRGEPVGLIAANLPAFYFGGLLVAGAVGGALADLAGDRVAALRGRAGAGG